MADPARPGISAGPLPVAPSLEPALAGADVAPRPRPLGRRILGICILAAGLGVLASLAAVTLAALIDLVTNLAYHGRWTWTPAEPDAWAWGWWTAAIPALGGLIVGLMARFGSAAIRGHGIPEAMEQVLTNRSRIPPRLVLLKPLSAAIAIGTGGPFGAEGPIIATGGALGSLVGQVLRTTGNERKTLLAAGAAAGMAATFGTPLSAVLLAIELLLFEFRPRSFLPVALAAATATACRRLLVGSDPAFAIDAIVATTPATLLGALAIGLAAGLVAVAATRAVYAIEDGFARLPLHWMWWPLIGGVVVGLVGLVEPRALGVGYRNIADLASDRLLLGAVLSLGVWKAVAWSLALGSGTSGGTLAPLFTIGGCAGLLAGQGLALVAPQCAPSPGLSALIGMAATFAGASHAVLASAVFAAEATRQPLAMVPLLAGCVASYLVARLAGRHSIMSEKIARRGVHVVGDYDADPLVRAAVGAHMTRTVAVVDSGLERAALAARFAAAGSHQAYPVVDGDGLLVGVVTRRDLHAGDGATAGGLVVRAPVVVAPDASLREAVELLLDHDVGRLVVVERGQPRRIAGIITRSDVLAVHRLAAGEEREVSAGVPLGRLIRR